MARPPDPDATQRIPSDSGPPPPPPDRTQVIPGPPPGGPRSRLVLISVLLFLLGLGAGFVLAQFFGDDDERIPDANLVLYESADTTFPIPAAAFTRSTYVPDRQECDRELLKQLLRADERRFRAWLELQDITAEEFDTFVNRLETRILTAHTPVTNHGCFAEGDGPCPFDIQSVLAPGTPVWFDPVTDRIVAKCACSNPLKSPRCPPNCEEIPTPTPTPTPTPEETPTPTPEITPTPPPIATPTPTPEPTPTPTPEETPTPVPQ